MTKQEKMLKILETLEVKFANGERIGDGENVYTQVVMGGKIENDIQFQQRISTLTVRELIQELKDYIIELTN